MSTTVSTSTEWRGKEVKIAGKRVVNKSAYEIGLIVEGQAKLLCAVDTGRLAGSVTTQASDHGTNPEAPATGADKIKAPTDENEVLVGTPVFYGPYLEFGTVRSNAQPFLRPALDLAQGKMLTVVEKHGRDEFREFAE